MDKKLNYGEVLRILKIANDITTKRIAELADVSSAYISEILNNKKIPSFKKLNIITEILNFTLYEYISTVEFYASLNPEISDLRKYQLTLIRVLEILIAKEELTVSEGMTL